MIPRLAKTAGHLAICLGIALGLPLTGSCNRTSTAPTIATRTLAQIEAAERAQQQRDYNQARIHYQRAAQTAPDAASKCYARHQLALALASWGEIDAATAQLQEAVRIFSASAAAWHDLGILLHKQMHTVKAESALRRAVVLAPHDPRPRVALAALLWKMGRLESALTEYRALSDLDLSPRLANRVRWAISQLETAPQPTPQTGTNPQHPLY